ncbi:MAG TPA: DUF2760 domain-containing protein [Blastocatellia bacterium]|jgi:hypothetical protein|nr:DUF2760 domain-containing protein [Blastocatellia bacterium]
MIGFGQRISYAFRSFFRILSSGEIPGDVAGELVKQPARAEQLAAKPARQVEKPAEIPVEKPADSTDRAVQMLAILQRDGRLIDFFTEDIAPYSDAQVGAAVRDLHQSCRQTLERYVKLEPIIASEEGQPVTVQDPFDPAAIKLIGNVTGKPPLRGLLRHRGWRVSTVNLPPLPDGAARSVVAPAEVEI